MKIVIGTAFLVMSFFSYAETVSDMYTHSVFIQTEEEAKHDAKQKNAEQSI